MFKSSNPSPNTGTILKINGKLLYAAFLSTIGWLIWPDSLLGWGWGYIAIIFWFSAVGLVIQALQLAVKQWLHDRKLSAFKAQGPSQTSAKMATEETLRDAGVLDD